MRHDTPSENYLDLKRDLERVIDSLEDITPNEEDTIKQVLQWKEVINSIKATVIEKAITELQKEI